MHRACVFHLGLSLGLAWLSGCGSPTVQQAAPWPSLHSSSAPALERTVELLHVELDLDLDPLGRRISGTVTLWLRALGRGAQHLTLAGSGVREVLDERGRSLAFEPHGTGLRVSLAEPLGPGEEMPLSVRFSQTNPAGVSFGETAPGPAWTPWISAGPHGDPAQAWFPLVEPAGACCTFEARVEVDHGLDVFLGGRAAQPTAPQASDPRGTSIHVFRSEQPLALARLGLAACRLQPAASGPQGQRVWLPAGHSAGMGRRLLEALGWREAALARELAVGPNQVGSPLDPTPPVVLVLPDRRAQRLDGVGVVVLGPGLAERLANGGLVAPLDPLSLALASQRVAGRHSASRPSEAWLLEAMAAHLALAISSGESGRAMSLWRLRRQRPSPALAQRAREVWGADRCEPSGFARAGASLFEQLAQEFGREALARAIAHTLASRRGGRLGPGDLARAFQRLDGRDLGPRLARLARSSAPPPTSSERLERLAAAGPLAATSDPDPVLRVMAAERLVQAGVDASSLPSLYRLASADPEPRVRMEVIAWLPADLPGVADFLLRVLSTESEPAVRVAAVAALEAQASRDENVAAQLRAYGLRETDPQVRAAYRAWLPPELFP